MADSSYRQKLEYAYDADGNLDWIKDKVAGTDANPQLQDFTYDNLDRLDLTSVTGGDGNGAYGEDDGYDANGRLNQKGSLGYTYDPTSKPNAVRQVKGSTTASKTITIRAMGTPYQSVYPNMQLYVNGVYITQWTVTGSYANYSVSANLSEADQIDVVFTNDAAGGGEDRNLVVDYVVVDGTTIQAEGVSERFVLAIIDWGAGPFDWSDLQVGGEWLYCSSALRFVKGAGGFAGGYDANGNMIARVVNGGAFLLSYDAENHLVQVQSSTLTATFVYDGNGVRVKATINGTTTVFAGSHYEVTGSGVTKYYLAGSVRVAMNRSGYASDNGLFWILGDHLGSTSITANSDGTRKSELRFKAWGEVRWSYDSTNTGYQFQGQYSYAVNFGLLYFGARWLDPVLGRFAQADSIIPGAGNVLAWDRYAGLMDNPVRYTDPTGHKVCDEERNCFDHGKQISGKSVDPVNLTENGANAKKLLEKLNDPNSQGWWNDQFGVLDVYDLLLLIVSYELGPLTEGVAQGILPESLDLGGKIELIKQGASNWFRSKCGHAAGGSCPGVTPNGILDWVGAMESGKDLYKVVDNLQEKLINIGRSPGLAGEVLNAIFHPKSEWNEADPNQPRYWGNRSNFYRDPKDYILAFDIEGKNPWYLLTASQNDYVH